jgi:hypothetical protein
MRFEAVLRLPAEQGLRLRVEVLPVRQIGRDVERF